MQATESTTDATHQSPSEAGFSRIAIGLFILGGITGAAFAFRQIIIEVRNIQPPAVDLPIIAAVPEFHLIRETGQPVASADLKGLVWVADFVFTRCAGPCPIMTRQMSDLQESIADLPDVRLVTFTVDPEYDTPKVLTRYAQRFSADPDRWHFLTGDRTAIYDLCVKGFKLAVAQGDDYDHMIIHSTKFVLVDRNGSIRGYYDGTDPDARKKLRDDLRALRRVNTD